MCAADGAETGQENPCYYREHSHLVRHIDMDSMMVGFG